MTLTRRDFAHALGMSAGLASVTRVTLAAPPALADDRTVRMSGDGIGLSPAAYAALLLRLTSDREVVEDNYLLGGDIELFEREWAELLGKEMAVFMPSGTLANQLALRVNETWARRSAADIAHALERALA
jgi:threonine aldolase